MTLQIQRILGSGALGAGGAYALSSLSIIPNLDPVNGAVFGVVGRLITEVTDPIFNTLRYANNDKQRRLASLLFFARFVGTVALTALACTALGAPISFTTALVLQVAQRAFSHLICFTEAMIGPGRPISPSFEAIA